MSNYARRRASVLQKMHDNSVMLITQSQSCIRNNDTEYPFRPDSRFYYLSGFSEQDAALLLVKSFGQTQSILFCQDKDPHAERWSGKRLGLVKAQESLAFDTVYHINELEKVIKDVLKNKSHAYYVFGQHHINQQMSAWLEAVNAYRGGVKAPTTLLDAREIIDELRLFKDAQEIQLMQKACDISVAAHQRAIRFCKPGMYEYEIEAEYLYVFYQSGSRYPAYPSIVGGGDNACILHYVENNAKLKDGELLLVDAGCEYGYYASDITRTYPVGKQFSTAQKALYELVLKSQKAAIEKIKPGVLWNEIQKGIIEILVQGLVDLNILKGDVQSLIQSGAHIPYYMHNSGHWIGMDVHDVGNYKVDGNWRPLQENMVLTVEPGLYIDQDADVPSEFKGIGIRIEDDILVTSTGYQNLTGALEKEVSQIEAMRN